EAISETSPNGRPAGELANACGINRATAWRLLATLEYHGLIERVADTNNYAIGFGISRLARTAGLGGLIRSAHPILQRVCHDAGETANLAVLQPAGLTYIDEVVPQAVITARWLGRQVPVHATSAGK